jgi:hypothetical protein
MVEGPESPLWTVYKGGDRALSDVIRPEIMMVRKTGKSSAAGTIDRLCSGSARTAEKLSRSALACGKAHGYQEVKVGWRFFRKSPSKCWQVFPRP